MVPPKIKLYVDTVSPFAYMGYHVLRTDPVFAKCEIEYVPIFLGGVMKMCNNATPISIKNKGDWLGKERLRWAKTFSVPMAEEQPPGFPSLTLPIMRALCALTILHPGAKGQELLVKCLDVLYHAYWKDHKNTIDKDILAETLTGVLGKEDTAKVMAMAGKEGKELLNKNSEAAFKDGAFGLPWFVATNSKGEAEKFWGVDHLGQVTIFLGLEKPKTGGWKAVL